MCGKCSRGNAGKKITKHGESRGENKTRLYNIWLGMRTRCNNPKTHEYKDYGGRGISVCEEWDDYSKFKNWAIANNYDNSLSIERINVNGNYEPSNCKWATMKEQSNNKRNTRHIEHKGIVGTLTYWERETGIKRRTLHNRIYRLKWSIEESLTIPVKIGNNKNTRKEGNAN